MFDPITSYILFYEIIIFIVGQPKTYYMYWNNNEKTWWIGESLTNNKALMKMQSNSSLKCPADPLGVNERKKDWQRKNSVGWWGDDSTATVRCGI